MEVVTQVSAVEMVSGEAGATGRWALMLEQAATRLSMTLEELGLLISVGEILAFRVDGECFVPLSELCRVSGDEAA